MEYLKKFQPISFRRQPIKKIHKKDFIPDRYYIFKGGIGKVVHEYDNYKIRKITCTKMQILIKYVQKLDWLFMRSKTITLSGIIRKYIKNNSTSYWCFYPSINLNQDLLPLTPMYKATKKHSSFIHTRIISEIKQITTPILKDAFTKLHLPQNIQDIKYALYILGRFEATALRQINNKFITKKIPLGPKTKEINTTMPYELNKDQINSLDEIIQDINSPYQCIRLLYGEVGSGKTIVSILAIKYLLESDHKVIYLAPTSILAHQVYNHIKNSLNNTDKYIQIINKDTKDISQCARIFIGTHAIISREISSVRLIIIDEQHKFGSIQKSKLFRSHSADLLMMTATPIPRTMQNLINKNIKYSSIKLFRSAKKYIYIADKEDIYLQDMARDKKIVYMCRSIEKLNYKYNNTECENKFIVHSKIANRIEVISDFHKQNNGIMFSTTVIETGLDIDIDIIIVEEADHYGVAQLHQISGRVGRRKDGYVYLLGKNKPKLNKFANIKSGLKLSKMDLSQRGGGSYYGPKQSGFSKFLFIKKLTNNLKLIDYDLLDLDIYQIPDLNISKNIIDNFFSYDIRNCI